MDDLELHSIVRGEIESAVNYHDTEFAGKRIKQMDYYLGEPLGNEQDGRSQVIQTEVADTIDMILPQLVKMFVSTDQTVRFEPRGPEDVEAAKQATEYVNFVLHNDNPGFRIIHDFAKDALISGQGVVKIFFDESENIINDMYTGLTDDELTALLSDDDVEVLEQEAREIGEPTELDDGTLLPAINVYDVKIKKTTRDGRIRIENVPPEEFLFNQRAKSLDDCRFVAHRTTMSISELISLGYDQELVEEYAGYTEIDTLDERQARFQDLESATNDDAKAPSERDVLVTEVYIKVDFDDDGVSEMRRLLCLGSSYEIIENDEFDMFPFAVMSPILMPHRMTGRSIAELLTDLQESKTAILRQLLDNIYSINNARMGAVEGQVNLDDLIANRPGGIVRMRAPNMVQPLAPPPVSDAAFPLLAYMDNVREMRTGMSKASMGLDPDALQSSTATAVQATVSAAQAKVELIARVMAETGIKDLMRCILKTVLQNAQQPRIIRLRNNFVVMDPQAWENEFDISINVGLGNGDDAQRMAMLSQVAGKQEQVLTQMGMENPLCTMGQYRATLAKMLEAAGFKNANEFFLDPDNLPPELQQKIQQKMQMAEGANNPALELERQKLETERQKIQADIALDREKMVAELELKREIQMQELQMKFEMRRQEMQLEAQLRNVEAVTGSDISTNIPRN
tara:strand:- start:3036 stop:5087 length:2052 start_codon:yes stop_codon:yes gene_type:complete